MERKIEVEISEIKEVFLLLEDLNDFFHQREKYSDIKAFAAQNYKRIHKCYYKTLWNWFPEDV